MGGRSKGTARSVASSFGRTRAKDTQKKREIDIRTEQEIISLFTYEKH